MPRLHTLHIIINMGLCRHCLLDVKPLLELMVTNQQTLQNKFH